MRRELRKQAHLLHTLLRVPTDIFYAQRIKANVFFIDRKPVQERPRTEKLWFCDLRTNKHFTLKEYPLKHSDLDDFVARWFGLNVAAPSRLFSALRPNAAAALSPGIWTFKSR